MKNMGITMAEYVDKKVIPERPFEREGSRRFF